jgi:hypothetical protein
MLSAILALTAGISAHAQSARPVTDYALSLDPTGQEVLPNVQEVPGEPPKYQLPSNTSALYAVFEFRGEPGTPVQVRMIAPGNQVVRQVEQKFDTPGRQVIALDNGGRAFDDNNYTVNAYVDVGSGWYIAASSEAVVGNPAGPVEAGAPAAEDPSLPPRLPGASPLAMAAAALGAVVLLVIMVWAARSALRAR